MWVQVHRYDCTATGRDHADAVFGDATAHGGAAPARPLEAHLVARLGVAGEHTAVARMHGEVEERGAEPRHAAGDGGRRGSRVDREQVVVRQREPHLR